MCWNSDCACTEQNGLSRGAKLLQLYIYTSEAYNVALGIPSWRGCPFLSPIYILSAYSENKCPVDHINFYFTDGIREIAPYQGQKRAIFINFFLKIFSKNLLLKKSDC